VQPILVKKGCMMLACHSPAQFHDYRLRGGSGGSFTRAGSAVLVSLSCSVSVNGGAASPLSVVPDSL